MAISRFHALLADRIAEAIQKAKDELAGGVAKDYAQYQSMVGAIRGMEDCLKLADEIDQSFDR